eukprot:41104-Amphidinium_carterae.1
MTTRAISPDGGDALPVNQGGLKVSDGRGHSVSVSRQLHFSTLPVPVRAAEDDVREVLRFLLATHTERPHMKRTVRTDFVPNPAKGGIKGTTEAVFSSVGTLLQ